MKKFMLLHIGFEKPTPEIMEKWKSWFKSIADVTIENIGLGPNAKEINHSGSKNIPFDAQAITGCSIIKAENMEEAEKLVQGNPFITSIQIHEIREH